MYSEARAYHDGFTEQPHMYRERPPEQDYKQQVNKQNMVGCLEVYSLCGHHNLMVLLSS
ncbi:hypothetical protein GDO81_003556 [Engystomops pustulosus]|uniref:Uncharacterized protein n=1 Tax=Engystomops pustulosus TaxID=76066 RepID=A0AAV7A233_ENGPU|nr:hypothetical protein GDO81_003556 [Engystomops pustulosus]